MATATCPECDESIRRDYRPRLGLRFVCPHCGTVVEVTGTHPLELDWAYDDDEQESSLEDVWRRGFASA
jgi:hypothetical protein